MVPSNAGSSGFYLHHYCVVRSDVPFGTQLAQLVHAAGESVRAPVPPTTHAVVLHAESEADLLRLEQTLKDSGFSFVAIREPDAPWLGQLMAIGVEPQIRSKQLKKLMSGFKLAR